MQRFTTVLIAVMALVVAACTSGPAAGTPIAGQPTATPTQVVQPTGAPPVGLSCEGVPTFTLTEEITFTRDSQLEAIFPTTIDGQPVENLTSGYWFELMCFIGGPAGLQEALSELPPGMQVATLSYASADVTIDDEDISLVAFRTPGQDANAVLQQLLALQAQTQGADTPVNFAPGSVGGKSVLVATNELGGKSYAYIRGDVMVFAEEISDSAAEKVFAALP